MTMEMILTLLHVQVSNRTGESFAQTPTRKVPPRNVILGDDAIYVTLHSEATILSSKRCFPILPYCHLARISVPQFREDSCVNMRSHAISMYESARSLNPSRILIDRGASTYALMVI